VSSKTTVIGAVEIGTSKVTALVGEYTGREIVIIGCGECSSRGVIKGSVVDFRAATECTHSALESAERDANERIDHVYLAQSGGHLEGFYNEASVNVKAADNMIEADDIRTVCDLAKAKELPLGRLVVHNIRRPFRVDGRLVPTSPENLVGQKLEVGYWTVHGQEQRLADNIHVIRGFNLEVRDGGPGRRGRAFHERHQPRAQAHGGPGREAQGPLRARRGPGARQERQGLAGRELRDRRPAVLPSCDRERHRRAGLGAP
jgi:cell division protein FtsA